MFCIPGKPNGSTGFGHGLVLSQGYSGNCIKSFSGAG